MPSDFSQTYAPAVDDGGPMSSRAQAKAAAKAVKKAEAKADFSAMTVAQLKDEAKKKGIEGITSMKKADLIAALSK